MLRSEEVVEQIPRLRRYARALTRDAVAADDLVQDTLERALGRLHLWQPGNVRAWLFSIMHNVFVNQVRSPRPDAVSDDAPPEQPVRAEQADRLEVRDLQAALDRLSAEHREVLLLVGLEELPYADAARVLGVPVGTVMSRLSRARERLRMQLAGTEERLKVVK